MARLQWLELYTEGLNDLILSYSDIENPFEDQFEHIKKTFDIYIEKIEKFLKKKPIPREEK